MGKIVGQLTGTASQAYLRDAGHYLQLCVDPELPDYTTIVSSL